MATGERTFNTDSVPADKTFDNSPVQPGKYTLRLRADKAADVPSKTSGISYVKVPFVVLGSGGEGPDKWYWHRFMLSLKPWANGQNSQSRGDSISKFVKAVGQSKTFSVTTETDTTGQTVDVLDPKEVLQFLQNNDGLEIEATLAIREGSNGYGPSNEIKRFATTGSTGPE